MKIAHFIPALMLILFGISGLGVAALKPAQGDSNAPLGVVVLGGDSSDVLRVIADADGRLISSGGWLDAAVAVSDQPDFVDELYRAGASVVFRADKNSFGCAGTAAAIARKS